MQITAARETIEQLWRALGKPDMGANPQAVAEIGRDGAASGWLSHPGLETALLAAEPRLYEIRARRLIEAFGIAGQWTYPRPDGRSTAVLGVEQIAAADVAHLLIQLERLGFAIDPAPFCAALLPALKARAYLTTAELAVFWHEREKHRTQPLVVAAGRDLAWSKPAETLRTAAGYRVEMFCGADERPVALRSVAPGRVRRSNPLRAA